MRFTVYPSYTYHPSANATTHPPVCRVWYARTAIAFPGPKRLGGTGAKIKIWGRAAEARNNCEHIK